MYDLKKMLTNRTTHKSKSLKNKGSSDVKIGSSVVDGQPISVCGGCEGGVVCLSCWHRIELCTKNFLSFQNAYWFVN